jgi:hypothetical protein
MKLQQRAKAFMAVTSVLAFSGIAAYAQPGVPPVDANNETNLQAQKHFLTFIGSFIPESTTSAKAYYKAIDPTGSKQNFTAWLVNAGFIQTASQWHATGKQLIACNLPGCDLPAGTYGDNVINTDTHAIVLNAADLGFVRNQFVRCKPSCLAPNPIIYTYLENYPVAPFATTSGFPVGSGYPTTAEAKAAIQSAITRPAGAAQRIADVAFEWAPPAASPNSSTRFGQLYAYIVDQADPTIETLTFPADAVAAANSRMDFPNGFPPIDFSTGARVNLTTNDYFAPELDGRGFKYHPGMCLVCHGGKPTRLTSTGAYPRAGRIDGFRFLPLDIRNLMFTSDHDAGDPLSRAAQELQMKAYNFAVLRTVDQSPEDDGTGTVRAPHVATVIKGWYAPSFTAATQNTEFVPSGWTGFENLYKQVVGPTCRSCHFNREISLDFGTIANFSQESDILQLSLLQQCNVNNPKANADFMPLAHLTYERYWQANPSTGGASQTLFFAQSGPLTISNVVDQIAQKFGFTSVAGYCATNP